LPLKIDSVTATVAIDAPPQPSLCGVDPMRGCPGCMVTSSTASLQKQHQLLQMTVIDLKERCRQLLLPVSARRQQEQTSRQNYHFSRTVDYEKTLQQQAKSIAKKRCNGTRCNPHFNLQ